MKRQLSRLSITGHVYEHTPICVLIEIADAHGIKYEQKDYDKPNFAHHLLASIHQTPVPCIKEIKELSEWQYVARFVNKHSEWPQSKLIQAYNFLTEFMNNEDPLSRIPPDFIYGPQTPENVNSINACILYKTCIHYRLNINARTTINQMAFAIKLLREDIESIVRRSKIFIDRDAKRVDLINVLMLSPYEIQDPEPSKMDIMESIDYNVVPKVNTTHEHLGVLHQSLNDIRSLQQKIESTTDSGCIALAAINYNIDISKSSNPMREYKLLHIAGRNDYKPADPWMQYWYQRNPALFDLSVTFNPIFPLGFYDNNRIIEMVQNEGYSSSEIANENPYELLQVAYVAETFYQGELPNMKSKQTPIAADDIDEVPYGELLCYGQLDSQLRPISITELTELFNINQNFSSPFSSDAIFSTIAINKLKLIIQNPSGPIPSVRLSPKTIRARMELANAIAAVELLSRNCDEPTRQFAFYYRNSDPDTKHTISIALTHLLNIGMYMRGWSGKGNYPVIKAPVPPEKELEVATNVTNAIAEYESTCRSLGQLGVQLNTLPLVTYKDGQYQISNDSAHGLTIKDRINIVKEGDKSNNINSCIRLSSNWICASAHKYITALGLPAPFDIFKLRHIS